MKRLLYALGVATLAAMGLLAWLVTTTPSVESLATENPATTRLVEQRRREAEAAGRTPRRIQSWVPLERVSERVVQAVVMAEDAAFWTHDGFDFYEIRQSIRKNIEKGAYVRGASTITQQLAKNLFLSTEKSILRKLREAILTIRLERALDKKRILELYLNVIEWGEGIYGVEAAARTYFGKSAAELDAAEAALLAAMIPAPLRLSRADAAGELRRRQERILGWMKMAGHLTEEEYREALERPLRPRLRPARREGG